MLVQNSKPTNSYLCAIGDWWVRAVSIEWASPWLTLATTSMWTKWLYTRKVESVSHKYDFSSFANSQIKDIIIWIRKTIKTDNVAVRVMWRKWLVSCHTTIHNMRSMDKIQHLAHTQHTIDWFAFPFLFGDLSAFRKDWKTRARERHWEVDHNGFVRCVEKCKVKQIFQLASGCWNFSNFAFESRKYFSEKFSDHSSPGFYSSFIITWLHKFELTARYSLQQLNFPPSLPTFLCFENIFQEKIMHQLGVVITGSYPTINHPTYPTSSFSASFFTRTTSTLVSSFSGIFNMRDIERGY